MMANEARQTAEIALRSRVNPAVKYYEMAKLLGYRAAPQQAPAPVAPGPVAKTELQAAKQAVAPSVSSGGKPPKKEMSPEDILNLDGAAFDSAFKKYFSPKKNSLFRD
jgi:hypothetical protein